MKTLTTLLLALVCLGASAQRLKEFTAINGITYHVGDTVKLNRGSGINGTFAYLTPGGLESLNYNPPASELNLIKRKFTRSATIIKKIKQRDTNGVKTVTFVTTSGFTYPLDLDINSAIEAQEVIPAKNDNK